MAVRRHGYHIEKGRSSCTYNQVSHFITLCENADIDEINFL